MSPELEVKEGCGMGACGAYTVLVDREAALACLTLALSAKGKEIRTVEGLTKDRNFPPCSELLLSMGRFSVVFALQGC